ncbi:hypothetical protein ACHAQH_004544 [Verticillium albo-atrum]
MPLHLLGKKSWNVYNADNIARVRRDEATAKAEEEAEEQRIQEVDAERRLAILRGEEPPPLPEPSPERDDVPRDRQPSGGRERKKRKRTGEDDTDFELRIAQERSAVVRATGDDGVQSKTSDAPIVDRDGHIDLFGEDRKRDRRSEKHPEAEKEAEKKKREYEDQYRMRLSSAPGRGGMLNPWYSKSTDDNAPPDEFQATEKDVWGNEDPGRKKRAAERITSNDPLAMMKQGAAKVREVKRERQKGQQERDMELEKMRREDRRRERRERDERRSERRHRDRRRDESIRTMPDLSKILYYLKPLHERKPPREEPPKDDNASQATGEDGKKRIHGSFGHREGPNSIGAAAGAGALGMVGLPGISR